MVFSKSASEGHYLDNFLDEEHTSMVYTSIAELLKDKNSKEQEHTLVIGDISIPNYSDLIADITLKGENITAEGRIKVSMVDI